VLLTELRALLIHTWAWLGCGNDGCECRHTAIFGRWTGVGRYRKLQEQQCA